jgi:hypothetical protein
MLFGVVIATKKQDAFAQSEQLAAEHSNRDYYGKLHLEFNSY